MGAVTHHRQALSPLERNRARICHASWHRNGVLVGALFDPAQANSDALTTVLVHSFAANPWGLYQVHGNVYDWVEDCWNDNYDGAPSDGSAWTVGNCDGRVLRGGAFNRKPQNLRSAARLWSGAPN